MIINFNFFKFSKFYYRFLAIGFHKFPYAISSLHVQILSFFYGDLVYARFNVKFKLINFSYNI